MNVPLARQLIEDCAALLLDFDGPMTTLLPAPQNAELARASMRPLLAAGVKLPPDIETATDHLKVIRWTSTNAPCYLGEVELVALAGEVGAARRSPITDALPELLALHGRKTVIVTNNAPEAVQALLARLGARAEKIPVCGRPAAHPELMKPSPYLVHLAAARVGHKAGKCVMTGDHASDARAAHAAGAKTVGFATSPRHLAELRAARTDAMITSWRDVLP